MQDPPDRSDAGSLPSSPSRPRQGGRRRVLWSALSDGIERFFQLGSVIFFAHVLGDAAFGVAASAQSLVNVLAMVVDAGTSAHGMRVTARQDEPTGRTYADLAGLRLTLALFVVLVLAISPILPRVLIGHRDVLLAAGAYLIVLASMPDWVLRGTEHFRTLAVGMVMGFGLVLTIVLRGVRGPADLTLAAGARAIFYGGAGVVMMLGARGILSPCALPRLRRWSTHLAGSLPIAGIQVAQTAAIASPILVLGSLYDDALVGHFAAAHRLSVAIASSSLVLIRPAFASFARLATGDTVALLGRHRRYVALFFALAAPIWVGGALTAPGIVDFLYGSSYAASGILLRILIGAAALSFFQAAYSSVLIAVGLGRPCLRAVAFGSVLTIPAVILGAWLNAGTGAAWGFFAGEVASLLLVAGTFLRRLGPSLPTPAVLLSVLTAILAMTGVLGLTSELHVLVRIGLGALAYLGVAALLGLHRRCGI